MGFFTKPDAAGAAVAPAPLSDERITAALDARDVKYQRDKDGDVVGLWNGHLFCCFLVGEQKQHLQVRGRWMREVGLDQLDRLTALVNTWNAEMLWPKGYVCAEDGVVGVYAMDTVDGEQGATDAQIDTNLLRGVSMGLMMFARLDEAYPDEAAHAQRTFRAAMDSR